MINKRILEIAARDAEPDWDRLTRYEKKIRLGKYRIAIEAAAPFIIKTVEKRLVGAARVAIRALPSPTISSGSEK